MKLRSLSSVFLLVFSLACSGKDEEALDGAGNGSTSAVGGSGSGLGSGGGSAVNGNGSGAANGAGLGGNSSVPPIDIGGGIGTVTGGGQPGNGMPETCDGIDNDENGIADDLDIGNDGVCDCLRIATLGIIGQWGKGDVFTGWLNQRSINGAIDLADKPLTDSLLAGLQVIVVQDVSKIGRKYSASEVAALRAWVEGGGGLMTLIGYGEPSERTNVNTLLGPFGISYDSEPILPKGGGKPTVSVTGWTAHPVTAGITALGVDNGYPVIGAGTVIGHQAQWDVLRTAEPMQGRVLVWGDEWITYNSEWVNRKDLQVELFWVNAIKWLTPPKQCQVAIPPSILR